MGSCWLAASGGAGQSLRESEEKLNAGGAHLQEGAARFCS